ncbi:MAG TPA: hypothetical protein VIG77_12470 [Ktedonobacterales bacterium]|jgi:hypothetical protein
MIQSTASPTLAGSAAASTTADTRLRGRGLVIARVGWIALTLLLLTLSAIALPRADALLQSVCQPGAPCLSTQLTQADLRLLHHLGLSPSFLAAYQLGWDVGTILTYSALAALIFWRHSQERMALFCAYMLVLSGGPIDTGLFDLGLRPLAPAWYWPVGVLDLLSLGGLLTFFLLFPRGRFVPRWTRWGVPVVLLVEAHYIFITDPLKAAQSHNPTDFLAFAALALSLVGLQIYRYRRVSTFRERQQTKWVVFGFSLAIVGSVVSFTLEHVFFPEQTVQSPVFQTLVAGTVSGGFLLLIPLSIAIAILRAQLWDIDTIINKALVYGLLTALLAALYAGLVIGLEGLAGAITGKVSQQPVVIVASTLAIAALFQPLRSRIQGFIDRRFFRRKFDAAKTLQAFSATLRTETDLSELNEQLMVVVQETMQPAHVSLWLRQLVRRPMEPSHQREPRGAPSSS